MPETKALLCVEDFALRRDGLPLVSGDSWAVERGQRLLLTGPSGSGKSSFLLALAGLSAEHAPGLSWEARVTGTPSMGILFQNPYSQLVCSTLDDELAFGLENAAWERSAMAERVAELKAAFGLGALGERAPWNFSGGEAQRVALASVLAPRPELVLLDEPLGYLDPAAASALVAMATDPERQSTWVVVDHDPEPWRAWADRHYQWIEGRWVQSPLPSPEPISPGPKALNPEDLSQPPALEVHGLTAGYGRGPDVLKNFDLRMLAGETVAVMGPSGSGKSTLFRCLAGQLKPRSGRFLVEGKSYRPRLNRPSPFTWVPQVPEHFFLYPTVEQEWGSLEAAQAFGLAALGSRHPFTLSEGEKRRLNLAAALTSSSPVLLLDEPQYGLDRASRLELERAIAVLQNQGRSLIVISHEPEFCKRVAHRIVTVAS